MNTTLPMPNLNHNRPVRLVEIFAALLITLRGLLGPDEEAADEPAANASTRQK